MKLSKTLSFSVLFYSIEYLLVSDKIFHIMFFFLILKSQALVSLIIDVADKQPAVPILDPRNKVLALNKTN